MEKRPYESLLASVRPVLHYSVDQAKQHGIRPTQKEFFGRLYAVDPSYDPRIKTLLQDQSDSFTVVCALTGRGKTSLVRNAINSLTGEMAFFLFDFKNEIEKFYAMGKDVLGQHGWLRDLLKEKLAREFLSRLVDKKRFLFEALGVCPTMVFCMLHQGIPGSGFLCGAL